MKNVSTGEIGILGLKLSGDFDCFFWYTSGQLKFFLFSWIEMLTESCWSIHSDALQFAVWMHTDDLCSTVHFGEIVQFVNLFSLASYIQGEKLK